MRKRAKILSLGKESLIIQKMMENIKVKTRQNKQSIKEGEERGELRMLVKLVKKGRITIEQAVEDAEMTVEQFEKVMFIEV